MQFGRYRIKNFAFVGALFIVSVIFSTPSAGQGFTYHWGHPSPQGNVVYGIAFKDASAGWAVTGCGSIMETTDGGESWELTADPDSICSDLYDIVISEQGTLVVSGDHGVIKRSTDDGESWDTFAFPAAGRLYDLALVPGGGVSAAGENGVVMVSYDDGTSWTDRGPGGTGYSRHHVWKTAAEGYVVGFGMFYRTLDGGDTWSQVGNPGQFGLNEIFFVNDNLGYAIEDFGFWKTQDGGAAWTFENVFTSPLYRFRSLVIDDLHWFAVSFVEGGELWETTDGGVNWEMKAFYNTTGFLCLVKNGDRLMFASDIGDILYTDDGGTTIQNAVQNLAEFISAPVTIIGKRPDGTLFANNQPSSGLDNGTFFRSDDDGVSWYVPVQTPGLRWVSDIEFSDDQHGVLGSYNDIRFTTDGGETWGESSLPETYNVSQFAYLSPGVFFAGTYAGWPLSGGNLFRSNDSGNSWEVVGGGLPVDDIRVTSIGFADAATGYIASLFNDQVTMYKSTDGGESWELIEQSGIPDYVADMLWLDENTGLAAVPNFEDAGIYRTTDGGLNWVKVSGTPASRLTVNSSFIAAINPGGVIFQESADSGLTWLPYAPPYSSSIPGNHGTVHSIQATENGYVIGGTGNRLMVAERDVATGIDNDAGSPAESQAGHTLTVFPNPVNDKTVISINLEAGSQVSLALFDVQGRLVKNLKQQYLIRGVHEFPINAGEIRQTLNPGIYFVILQTADRFSSVKVIISE